MRQKILVVDDHPFIQKFYATALRELPVRCYFAADGLEAVRIAEQVQPDIIFMDYLLPCMNGEEAALRIRQNPALANVKIIALSAESRSRVEQLKGFDAYLLKPVRADTIVSFLKQFLHPAPGAQKVNGGNQA